MTDPRSVSSAVTVNVSPDVAFSAFTGEMDLWWVRGPINFFDSARAVSMVCEPGVGGRILEVYASEPLDALEIGRITAWQPGERVCWHSSLDDVEVEVTFAPVAGGTAVQVLATVPAGGQDRGGTFWQRVVPDWFGAWCARREVAGREPDEVGRLAIAAYYDKPVTAARWLAEAFGLTSPGSLPEPEPGKDLDAGQAWLEFRVGRSSLMLFKSESSSRAEPVPVTHVPWIYVDDLDAHFARAVAAGAKIVEPIHQHGFRAYQAEDPEGHRWTFVQARPTMR
ncbi:MAG TPA: VOC family protein [Streptosporangiaceae bacterium]